MLYIPFIPLVDLKYENEGENRKVKSIMADHEHHEHRAQARVAADVDNLIRPVTVALLYGLPDTGPAARRRTPTSR
jgi:hypothetical protein